MEKGNGCVGDAKEEGIWGWRWRKKKEEDRWRKRGGEFLAWFTLLGGFRFSGHMRRKFQIFDIICARRSERIRRAIRNLGLEASVF